MSNLNESLAPPIEITLAGKVYKAGKLTLGDWAAFEQFAQKLHADKIIRTAERIYKDNIPESVLDKAIQPPSDKQLESYQSSITGLGFLLWKALFKYNPNMEQQDIMNRITLDDVADITAALMSPGTEKKTIAAENQ